MPRHSILRKEDIRHLTGQGQFLDNIKLPNMAYCAFVRSSYARAKILGVDGRAAESSHGVLKVLTAEGISRIAKPIEILHGSTRLPQLKPKPISMEYLASSFVRYVGQPVAAVIAEDRYTAEDATELVNVEYEPLEPVVSIEEALGRGENLVYEYWKDNIYFDGVLRGGDPDSGLKKSDHTFREKFKVHRHTAVPIEPRVSIADFHSEDRILTFYGSFQNVYGARPIIADALGMPSRKVRVIARDIGGGFGSKSHVYPEDIVTASASILLRRPVKWVETRTEHFVATCHARELEDTLEVGVKNDGTIMTVRSDLIADMGIAALTPHSGFYSVILTAQSLLGPYKIEDYECRLRGIVTNKTPLGAYRGFGQPEATYFMERMVDIIARELRLDPVQIRMKNMLNKEDLPYEAASGVVYDAGDFKRTLRKVLDLSEYYKWREKQRSARIEGRCIGIGLALNVESTSPPLPTEDFVTVRLEPEGYVTVAAGVSSIGTSLETVLARVVAQELGMDFDSIRVEVGDTELTPHNLGVFGSRSTIVLTTGALHACRELKKKILAVAAQTLGVQLGELRVRRRGISRIGEGKILLPFKKLVRKKPHGYFESSGKFTLPVLKVPSRRELKYTGSYTNAAHVGVIEVDPESGRIEVLRYVVVHDAGKVMIPEVVEGQVIGGVAQGLGGALLEELSYTQEGQLATSTLMDYVMPTAVEMPSVKVEHLETVSEILPIPYKGVGEAGPIGCYAVISNALHDALSPFNVKINDLPLTPPKIWNATRRS